MERVSLVFFFHYSLRFSRGSLVLISNRTVMFSSGLSDQLDKIKSFSAHYYQFSVKGDINVESKSLLPHHPEHTMTNTSRLNEPQRHRQQDGTLGRHHRLPQHPQHPTKLRRSRRRTRPRARRHRRLRTQLRRRLVAGRLHVARHGLGHPQGKHAIRPWLPVLPVGTRRLQ